MPLLPSWSWKCPGAHQPRLYFPSCGPGVTDLRGKETATGGIGGEGNPRFEGMVLEEMVPNSFAQGWSRTGRKMGRKSEEEGWGALACLGYDAKRLSKSCSKLLSKQKCWWCCSGVSAPVVHFFGFDRLVVSKCALDFYGWKFDFHLHSVYAEFACSSHALGVSSGFALPVHRDAL